MSVSREELTRRVHATRRWLEKAEESFRNRSTVKGELNLLLAQAEWQKLREQRTGTVRALSYWYESAALAAALLIMLWFVVGPVWQAETNHDTAVPIRAVREVPSSLVLPGTATLQWRPSAVTTAPVGAPAVATETVAEVRPMRAETTAEPLSGAELNSVVSDARKVLRGRA